MPSSTETTTSGAGAPNSGPTPVYKRQHSNPIFNEVLKDLDRNNVPRYCDIPKCDDCGACLYDEDAGNTLNHKSHCHYVEKCEHCGACMDYVNRGWSYHGSECPLDPKCDGCGESVRHSHGRESTGHHDEKCYRVPKCQECGIRTDRYSHRKECSQF